MTTRMKGHGRNEKNGRGFEMGNVETDDLQSAIHDWDAENMAYRLISSLDSQSSFKDYVLKLESCDSIKAQYNIRGN